MKFTLLLFFIALLNIIAFVWGENFVALNSGPVILSEDGSSITSYGMHEHTYDMKFFGGKKLVTINQLSRVDTKTQWTSVIDEVGDLYLLSIHEGIKVLIDIGKYYPTTDEPIVQAELAEGEKTGIYELFVITANHLYVFYLDLKNAATVSEVIVSQQKIEDPILVEPIKRLFRGYYSNVEDLDMYGITASGKAFLLDAEYDEGTPKVKPVGLNWFPSDDSIAKISPYRIDDVSIVLSTHGRVCLLTPIKCKLLDKSQFSNKNIIDVDAQGRNFIALADDGSVFQWGSTYTSSSSCVAIDTTARIQNTPRLIASSSFANKKVKSISAGKEIFMAKTEDGELYVWGNGTNYRLGTYCDCERTAPAAFFATRTSYMVQRGVGLVTGGVVVLAYALLNVVFVVLRRNKIQSLIAYGIFAWNVVTFLLLEIFGAAIRSYRNAIYTSIATILVALATGIIQFALLHGYKLYSRKEFHFSAIQQVCFNALIPVSFVFYLYVATVQTVVPQFINPHIILANDIHRIAALAIAAIVQFVLVAIFTNTSSHLSLVQKSQEVFADLFNAEEKELIREGQE